MQFHKRGPTPKRKLSADDKVEHKRRYDACERKREFQPHWLKQFSWLEYKSSSAGAGVAAHAAAGVGGAADRRDDDGDRRDDDADRRDDDPDRHDDDADRRDDAVVDVEGGESEWKAKNTETELSMRMYCKYCCKYEKAGSFVVGSPVFKLECIKAHNSSADHMKWALREKAESNPGSSVADKMMDQLGRATFDKMCKLLRNAHAITRHSRPYTDFVWMCTLDDMKGVQIGNTYINDKQCATFIHHSAQAQRDEIKKMVTEAKFVSSFAMVQLTNK